MSVVELAHKRMTVTYETSRVAQEEAVKAEAEYLRLCLLGYAETNPSVAGLSYQCEYQYDDEGGYFRTISFYPLVTDGDGYFEGDFDMDFADEWGGFTPESVCLLCGDKSDAWEGQVTLAEARERSF